jgi:hypothetical protein
VLHPVDYDIADAIRTLGCGVPKLDGWEQRIAQHVKLPGSETDFLVRESIERLEGVGVVKLHSQTGILFGGQIRPIGIVLAELTNRHPLDEETVEVILLNTVKLAEARQACGKDLFREPVIPGLVSA